MSVQSQWGQPTTLAKVTSVRPGTQTLQATESPTIYNTPQTHELVCQREGSFTWLVIVSNPVTFLIWMGSGATGAQLNAAWVFVPRFRSSDRASSSPAVIAFQIAPNYELMKALSACVMV